MLKINKNKYKKKEKNVFMKNDYVKIKENKSNMNFIYVLSIYFKRWD